MDLPESEWRGKKLVDLSGEDVGEVEEAWVEGDTDRVSWLVVLTPVGRQFAYLPDFETRLAEPIVRLPYEREIVEAAPTFDLGSSLDTALSEQIVRHYASAAPPGPPVGPSKPIRGTSPEDEPGPK